MKVSMKTKEQIYDFLASYQTGVLATISESGLPSAAIVGFGLTKELELLIGTNVSTRKYKNLRANPHVAFAVGGETAETVQFEGIARELGPDELQLVRDNYWQKNPHAEVYHQNPGERNFILTPTWIRYTNLETEPWDVTVLEFGSEVQS
jgi:uncharacterized protein YhbP (UPF0306 family)